MERQEAELCPHCGNENILEWDVENDGFQITCSHCGKKIMLCDACLHSEDNKEQRCDFSETGCFRKNTLK